MNLNWFLSRSVRQADQMIKHVRKIMAAQRDILAAESIQKIENSMEELRRVTVGQLDKKALNEKMAALETTANKWLKPYPHPGLRENVEVLLVAIAVAMGIRTFFVQPFKIPTGSMQPTLYGITSEPDFTRQPGLGPEASFEMPGALSKFFIYWFTGVQYKQVVAKADGVLRSIEEPRKFLLFNLKQSFVVGDEKYTVWFPPENLLKRAGLQSYYGEFTKREFKKDEDILKIRVTSGDHLFVDRMTYNFRPPKRGEIIVFETDGISGLPPGQFYIKRLVGLGGEKLRIGDDRHLVVNGKRLDASTPHFENVYSFDPAKPPRDSHYSGHVNNAIQPGLAAKFPDEKSEFTLQPNHFMVMGDNTMNSSDSRTWGDFPRERVIGKSFFVYWPIGAQKDRTSRFGWGNR